MPIMQYYSTKPSESEMARQAYYKRRRMCLRGLRKSDLNLEELSQGRPRTDHSPTSSSQQNRHRYIADKYAMDTVCNRIKENQFSLLRTFPRDVLLTLFRMSKVREFRREFTIIKQGDTAPKYCYLLLRGHVSVTQQRNDCVFQGDNDYSKSHLEPYDSFGELALYDPWAPAENNCVAEDDVECLEISPQQFEFVIRNSRERALHENQRAPLS